MSRLNLSVPRWCAVRTAAPIIAASFITLAVIPAALHAQQPGTDPKDSPTKPPPKLSLDELDKLAGDKPESVDGRPPGMTFPMEAKDVFKVQDRV